MEKPFDEQTLIHMLQNDKQKAKAFGLLVKQYQQQLYWAIRKMVLCHDDANDVLQNTCIKAWAGIANFRGDAKLFTWLYRIAINETLSFLKKQRMDNVLSVDDEENFLLQKMEADPYFDGEELQQKLQKAILTLPEKQRLVFNMKYFEDMKYEEMEEVLGTSVGALKASYHFAVKKIETFINEVEL
ncbi:MAG: sigma-70 family RNA polymerase sigma factor [Paludibacteraceae bacterium]|nr:sigma-70 family RNA polymerase sigma factor [Paludibacteraceae bacterium]